MEVVVCSSLIEGRLLQVPGRINTTGSEKPDPVLMQKRLRGKRSERSLSARLVLHAQLCLRSMRTGWGALLR